MDANTCDFEEKKLHICSNNAKKTFFFILLPAFQQQSSSGYQNTQVNGQFIEEADTGVSHNQEVCLPSTLLNSCVRGTKS